ncbi:DUF2911 domain-containing protein [Arundinibacter roseus]|uniref:DUF2911 domain-containing protein n=1 Tax=Arundinibacter roseus TaxID=2070510 RepID=A0A4R4KND7_9BACT|nr:DUF2911 domain-containing protein [Arundinibacter roseus]TDB68249.1 DUF2911 domain-containing protein [Arundinibacter roseus]
MKKYYLSFALALAIAGTSLAQRTPQASPAATLMQTVGVTDFTVVYSRPAVKGRTIFGDSTLVPYGQVWRTGANMATTLQASTDFMFGGKLVPAGKYALFSVPNGGEWTLILNKNFNQGGTADYKESEDVARVMAAPASAPFAESFTISFSDITDSTSVLNVGWASVNVPVKITVMTTENTMAAMDKAVSEKPEDPATLQTAANYMLSKGKDLPKALALADKSIGLGENFRNLWLKAQILAKMGKVAEAVPLAQKALALGQSSNDSAFGFMKPQIENGLKGWQAMLPAAATSAVKNLKGKKK